MSIEYISTEELWTGEPINGARINHAALERWSVNDLAAVGLRRRPELTQEESETLRLAALMTPDHANAARQRVVAFADVLARTVTGDVPECERASWGTKEMAARAYIAGTATAIQIAMLQAEIDISGETLGVLADKIIANADAYVPIAGMIAGQRRKAIAGIDALEIGVATVGDLEAVLAASKAEAEAMLASILAG